MFRAITFDFWNTLYPAIGQVSSPDIYELRARELRGFLVELGHDFPRSTAATRPTGTRKSDCWNTGGRTCGTRARTARSPISASSSVSASARPGAGNSCTGSSSPAGSLM
jgi:hypothetical protein